MRPDIGLHLFYRQYNRLIIFCFEEETKNASHLANSGLIHAGLKNNKLILATKNNDMEFFKAFTHQMYSYISSDIEEHVSLARLVFQLSYWAKSTTDYTTFFRHGQQ
jgi:hypothetical protein